MWKLVCNDFMFKHWSVRSLWSLYCVNCIAPCVLVLGAAYRRPNETLIVGSGAHRSRKVVEVEHRAQRKVHIFIEELMIPTRGESDFSLYARSPFLVCVDHGWNCICLSIEGRISLRWPSLWQTRSGLVRRCSMCSGGMILTPHDFRGAILRHCPCCNIRRSRDMVHGTKCWQG